MTSFDEHATIERLRTLAGDATVTDQDVAEARARLRARLTRPPTRRPAVSVAAAVAAALAVVALLVLITLPGARRTDEPGPGPDPATQPLDPDALRLPEGRFLAGRTPTTGQLVGVWHLRSSDRERVLAFGGDGRLLGGHGEMTSATDANLLGSPADAGTFELRGDSLVVTVSRAGCPDPWTVTSRVALMTDGSLHLLTTDDTSTSADADCKADPRAVWDRVSPGPSVLLGVVRPGNDWVHHSAAWTLVEPGLYVTRDGGWVLQLDSDRTYRAYRGGDLTAAPADSGRILPEDAGPGILTMTCRGGRIRSDVRLAHGDAVTGVSPSHQWLSGTVLRSGCTSGLGEGAWEWMRLLPEPSSPTV